jgi:hypothetical protein
MPNAPTISFHELCLLTWLMRRFGGVTPDTTPGVLQQLGRSQADLGGLLAAAAALGFVESRREEWLLTPAGEAIGIQMGTAMQEIATVDRRQTRPYDGYLPGNGRARA